MYHFVVLKLIILPDGRQAIGVSEYKVFDYPIFDVEVELENGDFLYVLRHEKKEI